MISPRKLLLVALLSFAAAGVSAANDIYLAQNAQGANNGADCADAFSYNFFNNSGNWGGGGNQIGPGSTVHLCGTFNGTPGQQLLVFQGSGTSGNPITLHFEDGVLLSAPYWSSQGAINTSGSTWVTIDGGTSGTIQNYADGVSGETCYDGNSCQYQQDSRMVYITGCTTCNVEVKNLTLRQGWQRNSGDSDSNGQGVEGIYFVGNHSNITIDHNTCTQFRTCIDGWGSNITVSFNELSNMNWGYSFGSNVPTSTLLIHDNIIHDFQMWDGSGAFHHDGVFLFPNTGTGNISGLQEYNNFFGPNRATGNTAYSNWEGTLTAPQFFNNVCLQPTTDRMPCLEAGNNGGQNSTNSGLIVANNTAVMGCTAGNCDGNYAFGPQPGYLNMTFQNNIAVQGTSLTYMGSNDVFTTVDYNMYEDVCSDNGACGGMFTYRSMSTNSFTTWKAALPQNSGQDGHSVFDTLANLGISTTTGQLQTGSPGIAAGVNLTSLGIAALNCDKPLVVGPSGTGACNPRPATGSWDIGAYQFGSGGTPPAPPTGLTAIVK